MKIVILGRNSRSTRILYNALSANYKVECVVLEDKVKTMDFFHRRMRKLGLKKVIGQIVFLLTINKFLRFVSFNRVKEIMSTYGLSDMALPINKSIQVQSINDLQVVSLLSNVTPDLVVISGTRIIGKKLLESIKCPFINLHAGITPAYRGVHGAYWALVDGRSDLAGVTIHLVDNGIDTGRVLAQKIVEISPKDNFSTYPLLQLAEGMGLLKHLIAIFESKASFEQINSIANQSKLHSHPTIIEYIRYRLHGIK